MLKNKKRKIIILVSSLIVILCLAVTFYKVCFIKESTSGNKVAIISCCYGGFEATTKPVVEQTVPCDKILFTDCTNINNEADWIVDTTPYHVDNNKYINSDYTNSWRNNKTNYMISKYYKAQFLEIPRLKKYDYILVMDGTMGITNKDCIKMLIEKTQKESTNMISWVHDFRWGELYNEALASSQDTRWNSTTIRGQNQPFQDVLGQYNSYIENGYSTEYWRAKNQGPHYGVFCTGFNFYKNNDQTRNVLDQWYEEILRWSTQCQVSYSYVLQKNESYKFSVLPDENIVGRCADESNIHKRYDHGK